MRDMSSEPGSNWRSVLLAGGATLLLGFVIMSGASFPGKQRYTTWDAFGGSLDSLQYSALSQINKTNVNQIERVWFYPATGEGLGRFNFSPLVVDDVMYVGGKDNRVVVALDAATGEEIWTHPTDGNPTNRGYAYWQSEDGSDRRIIFSVNGYLQEVDARTGEKIKRFGNNGIVDLGEGLGVDPATIRRNASTPHSGMPGHVFENLIILGSAVGEGYDDPPGWLRAYDVRTGELAWTFHTIPLPGEYGYETWPPAAYKYTGGVNTWASFSIDEERGIAYFPLGSPTYDFYGARRKGMGLFGNCLLALDARTGKRIWHFQTVHHDLWDFDLATSPKLMTVRHNGEMVDVVAQGTKQGLLFVFNRVTGEPLWPIEERPVPKSDVPGEKSWPTQPFPTKPPPFAQIQLSVDNLNPYVDTEEAALLRKIFLNSRHEGPFTPPSAARDHISMPGAFGGTNWGGVAGDPETGMLYVRAENSASIRRLYERSPTRSFSGGTPEQQGHVVWAEQCESCHGPGEVGAKLIKERDPDRLETIIRGGVGEMPGVGFSDVMLNKRTMNVLLAFIANPTAGVEPPESSRLDEGVPRGPYPNGEARRYTTQFGARWLTSTGLPANPPPWSELVAYDLNQGTIKWRIPLGTVPKLAAKGIKDTGSIHPTQNGVVVTGGGLIFMGTSGDNTIRAYDKDTGQTLWEKQMEATPKSIPAVYEVGGRQYVAFFMKMVKGNPEAQGYHVFALPESDRE